MNLFLQIQIFSIFCFILICLDFCNGVLINENGEDIAVYDISGRKVYAGRANDVTMPQKGIYVVIAGTKTFKLHS